VRRDHDNILLSILGHINHSLFWKNLAPESSGGGELRAGPLKDAIERDFGSLDELKKQLNTQTAAIQGSGWGWLVRLVLLEMLLRLILISKRD
jgi:superoxide dismutase